MNIRERDALVTSISTLLNSLNKDEKREIFSRVLKEKKIEIPVSCFNCKLSPLEVIVKYLKENKKKSFNFVSKLLNRNLSTIYSTYQNSKSKFSKSLDVEDSSICIPLEIFANRKFSVLETIVSYMKDKLELSVSEISMLLGKDYSTIKTVYRRFTQKNG